MFKATFCELYSSILSGHKLILSRSKGLPKKAETFLFFQIDDAKVQEFRSQLANLIPLITTAAQALDDQKKILQSKHDAAHKKVAYPLLKLSGVNVAFTHSGLRKVSFAGIGNLRDDEACCRADKIRFPSL